jgi:hypothetical protein
MTNEPKVEQLVEALLQAEGEQIVRDMAGHVGDEIHAVLKRHGMTMRTTAGAIGVGVLAAVQVLGETIEFAKNSMDGDDADADAIVTAANALFDQERRCFTFGTVPATPPPAAPQVDVLREALNDAVSGLRYIEQHFGRLAGVGWDRVFDAHATLTGSQSNVG